MKIKVKQIKPNPYRNVDCYPFDKAKIENLKRSISEKTFWDNILVREKKDGTLELVYGHHRLEALKQLKIQEINVPVRSEKDVPDSLMVQIMAEENLNWSASPAVINQTVEAAKKYLDGEFTKANTLSDLSPVLINLLEQKTDKSFNKTKAGVGQTTILKFLGGNWKQWMIQSALDTLGYTKESKQKHQIDKIAIGTIPSLSQANIFKQVVRDRKLKPEKQRQLAKKIADENIGLRSIVEVADSIMPPPPLKKKKYTPKTIPMLDDFVDDLIKELRPIISKLIQVEQAFDNIQNDVKKTSLYLTIKDLQRPTIKILARGEKNEKKN